MIIVELISPFWVIVIFTYNLSNHRNTEMIEKGFSRIDIPMLLGTLMYVNIELGKLLVYGSGNLCLLLACVCGCVTTSVCYIISTGQWLLT